PHLSYPLSLHDALPISFDELIAHLRAQQIASFKLPERLEILESFPISPVGKILKRELREIVAQRMAQEQASHPREESESSSAAADRKSTRLNSSHQIIS